jgi:MFS family permease
MTTASLGLVISAFAVATALAKILAGLLADYWDTRVLLFVSALCLPLSLAIFAWFSSYPALVLASTFAGLASGGIIPTSASLIAARFGAVHFGSVMGWTYALVGAATILAVLFSGTVFDLTGGYRGAFLGLLGFSLAVIALALLIDMRLRPPVHAGA